MRIHFIAIGGSIMHNLAIALHKRGYEVTGSDDEIFEPAKSRLAQNNLLQEVPGWHPEKIDKTLDAIILGMHAKNDNPELVKAREVGIPVYSFPEFINQEIKDKQTIVIAGSHGKTTITSMIMHVFKGLGWTFDYMVGAPVEGFEDSVSINESSALAVLEGDEYLSSPIDSQPKFLHYEPQTILISGLSWDHMNVFPTYESYVQAFRDLLNSMPPNSEVIYFEADPELVRLVREFETKHQLIPYWEPDWTLINRTFHIQIDGQKFPLSLVGLHNLWNLEGAKSVCKLFNIDSLSFIREIQTFKGAGKRLELMAEQGSTFVYRDFAHAPSKVKATIEGLKAQFPDKKLIACIELHTFSSLNQDFLPLYQGSTEKADACLIFVNPHALAMKGMPDIAPGTVKKAFGDPNLWVFKDEKALMDTMKSYDPDDSVTVFMSSGNFNGYELEEWLANWLRSIE